MKQTNSSSILENLSFVVIVEEFPTPYSPFITDNESKYCKESRESMVTMRPVHVKRLDLNNDLTSRRGIVATDIALVNIEEIKKTELVSRWIEDCQCVPQTSEQNRSCASPPIFATSAKEIRKLEEDSFPGIYDRKIEKSPIIKCRKKFIDESRNSEKKFSRDFTKSPKIGKRRRSSADRKSFGSWDTIRLYESQSSSPSDKSPTLGKIGNRPRVKRKRFKERVEVDNNHIRHLDFKGNGVDLVFRIPSKERDRNKSDESNVTAAPEAKEEITSNLVEKENGQDVSDEEIITASPKLGTRALPRRRKIKEEEDCFCYYEESYEKLKRGDSEREEKAGFEPDSKGCSMRDVAKVKEEIMYNPEDEEHSQNVSDEEIITASPKLGTRALPRRRKIKEEEDCFCYYEESNEKLKRGDSKRGEEAGLEPELNGCSISNVTTVKEEIMSNPEDKEHSEDIFDEERITASPKLGTKALPRRRKEKEGEDCFCSYEEVYERLKNGDSKRGESGSNPELKGSSLSQRINGYPLPLVDGSAMKTKKIPSYQIVEHEQKSWNSTIQDTEEFIVPERLERNYPEDKNRSKQDDKFLILDSEFSMEKREFVTDTERIDCDTSSENDGDNPELGKERSITRVESESDKTVSDLIEESRTQDYSEASKSEEIISPRSSAVPLSPRISIPPTLPKNSDTISPGDLTSPQISLVDISVETSPPRTPESFHPAVDLLDSGKKKKYRPKKGSLGARLQKLISGQVSCVRLWRHQMSRESAIERSSAPCTTLLVLKAWIQYEKNLYLSRVIEDQYDLLKDCFDARERTSSRNLVVMTNPDFVGSIKLLPGTVFKIYLPWDVLNRNSPRGNLVLHALYFNVVSNPIPMKLEPYAKESQASGHSNEIRNSEIIREYNCPCLENGKIDDSCLNKFTDRKIDIIAEIVE